MTELDGNTKKQLHFALIKALPTKGDWERMVSFELNASLSEISSLGPIDDIAIEVIRWAISKGRENDLINGARKHNDTNPDLLQFYRGVWQPLIDADMKSQSITQIPIATEPLTTLSEMNGVLNMNGISPTSSTSKSNGASPKPIDPTQPIQAAQLRINLLTYSTEVYKAIEEATLLLTQERDFETAFLHIKQKHDDLYTVLSNLLKTRQVNVKLHTQFKAEKDFFKEEVQKVILPIVKQDNQRPLSYNARQGVCTKLASLTRHLKCIERYICLFCDEID